MKRRLEVFEISDVRRSEDFDYLIISARRRTSLKEKFRTSKAATIRERFREWGKNEYSKKAVMGHGIKDGYHISWSLN